jgi:uncharacterized membrane protein
LSFWLFRRSKINPSWVWWCVLFIFVIFLPNAPYLLTDIVHLIRATQAGFWTWVIIFVLIPLHISAIVTGFEAYVISVMNISHYLSRQGLRRYIVPVELFTHTLCAVGVFMGRFQRFNSWDLVKNPDTVVYNMLRELSDKEPVIVIGATFVGLTVLYWVFKQINIGLWLRFQQIRDRRNARNFPQRNEG